MKAARNLFSFILVLTVISSGLPLYHPSDINRDDRVDLKDAILNVRDIVRSADNLATFSSSMENAVSSLQVAAGLKTVMKPSKASTAPDGLFILDLPCLSSRTNNNTLSDNGVPLHENAFGPLKSLQQEPVKPPPRPVAS